MITATYSLIARWFNQSAACFWPSSINLCSVKEKKRKWWVWKFSENLCPNYRKTYSATSITKWRRWSGIYEQNFKLYNIVVCLRVQLTLPRLKGTLIDFTFTTDRSCSNLTTTHSFRSIFAHPTIGVFYYVVKFIVIYGLLKSNVSPNRKIPKPTAWRDPCHSPL